MKFNMPKALMPVALTMAMSVTGTAAYAKPAAAGNLVPAQGVGHSSRGDNGPLHPSDYPGISEELRHGIENMNRMYNAIATAEYMAKQGDCTNAQGVLLDAKKNLYVIDMQRALTTGSETEEVCASLLNSFRDIKAANRQSLSAINAYCQ